MIPCFAEDTGGEVPGRMSKATYFLCTLKEIKKITFSLRYNQKRPEYASQYDEDYDDAQQDYSQPSHHYSKRLSMQFIENLK